ncbi:MAG: glycosyltransferase family 39 protein [Phycisphaerales bacterium]|nr:glycosyltransferase family 39 protein [Phycisphaerales bacterium]
MYVLSSSGMVVREAAPPRAAAIALAVTVILVAAVSRLVYLIAPFDGDGAMFAYMGKLVAEGGRFGEDLLDNKFPTVGLVTSAFYRAFGSWWPGYVIGQLILTFLAAAILARQAARCFGEHARWSTFIPAIVLLNINAAVMGGFQLETLQSFFAAVAAACSLAAIRSGDRRDALACGLASGCAMLIKPTGAAVLTALVLVCLITPWVVRNRRPRAIGGLIRAALVGAAFPLAVGVLYLEVSDQLRMLPVLAQQIAEYARCSSFAWEDALRPGILLFLFAAAMLIRGWVYRRDEHQAPSPAQPEACWFAWGWLILELVGVLLQRRMYAYHFLPLACPAALVFASLPRRVTVAQLAGPLALPVLFSIWGARDTVATARAETADRFAVTRWLEAHTLPGERIWHDNTPFTLIHTDLRPASRVQLTFLFMNSDEAPARFSTVLLDDLRAHRPRFLALQANLEHYLQRHTQGVMELSRLPERRRNFVSAWRQIEDFAHNHYQPVATVGRDTIWRRKDAS